MRIVSTLLTIVILAAIGYGVYALVTNDEIDPTPPEEENGDQNDNGDGTENGDEDDEANLPDTVDVYVVELEAGDIGCGDALVALERDIEPTQAVLAAALNELFTLEAEDLETENNGYYNALEDSDLEVESAVVEDGTATVSITGEVSTGGVCDDPRFVEQIRQTALQFDTVDEAEITVNDTPLEELFNAQGE